jgi:TPP-dependent pyruvate/acetoin dehydrogenase alpha subunit
MRRYPAFDPPEYVSWEPDPLLVRTFRDRIETDEERAALVQELEPPRLLDIYRHLLRNRLLDIGLKRWVRQGVISKAWLGTGEEAVTVGSVYALDRDRDVTCPMIRNAAACFMMGMPMADLFRGYLATPDSPSGGRDLHVGDLAHRVIQPVSQMGANVPVMAGVALAFRNREEPGVAMTWIGDGATKTGACHEGLNFAAVQNLPVVFVLQDNQVALGTRADRHGAGSLEKWGKMYGIPTWSADGNNVLDVYAASALAVARCREGAGPALVNVRTFRMGGHATHDEGEARATFPDELFRSWGKRDPVALYEVWLSQEGFAGPVLERTEEEVTREVEAAAEEALASRGHSHDPDRAGYDGFSTGPVLAGLESRPV